MNVKIVGIGTSAEVYADAERLMERAFPAEERRPTEQQRDYADNNRYFHATAIMTDNVFAGIMNYWDVEGATYIEHLAVVEEMRGRGIASEALRQLASMGRGIILEVEPPTDDVTRKRVKFYESNGFRMEDVAYMQPSYAKGMPQVELKLMTQGIEGEVRNTIEDIRKKVYGVVS